MTNELIDTKEKVIKEKLPLTSDIVFKRVFSREGSESILKDLLEAVLEARITKVIVKNPELPPNLYDSKAGLLDIKVQIDENTLCDIEMQVKNLNNIDKRSTYYISKLLSEDLKKGREYSEGKKVIAINFLNFKYYKRNSYRSVAHMKFEKTKKNEYVEMGYKKEDEIATTDLEMHFIEIPKFIEKDSKANTKLEQWLWLISGREDKLEMAKKENKEIEKAMEIIDEMSMDEKEWELLESRRLAIMDYNTGIHEAKEEGREEGIAEGENNKKNEIIKSMLENNMDEETICTIVKITKEELEEIKKKM